MIMPWTRLLLPCPPAAGAPSCDAGRRGRLSLPLWRKLSPSPLIALHRAQQLMNTIRRHEGETWPVASNVDENAQKRRVRRCHLVGTGAHKHKCTCFREAPRDSAASPPASGPPPRARAASPAGPARPACPAHSSPDSRSDSARAAGDRHPDSAGQSQTISCLTPRLLPAPGQSQTPAPGSESVGLAPPRPCRGAPAAAADGGAGLRLAMESAGETRRAHAGLHNTVSENLEPVSRKSWRDACSSCNDGGAHMVN